MKQLSSFIAEIALCIAIVLLSILLILVVYERDVAPATYTVVTEALCDETMKKDIAPIRHKTKWYEQKIKEMKRWEKP